MLTFSFRLFNGGSPYGRPAGHRAASLEAVNEHYRKQYEVEEERKIQRLAALKKAAEAESC